MLRKQPFWRNLLLLALFVGTTSCSFATSTDSIDYPGRKKLVIIGTSAGFAGTMTGLYHLWYKDYPLTKFHFHNDNRDWFQMDKVGHMYSCYYEGVVGIDMFEWAGFTKKQSTWIGGSLGFFVQSGIEIFDGFSEAWGASKGDIIANALGTGMAIGQHSVWDEQRVWMKLSFQPSPYSEIRPELLGTSFTENLFKDYNGQTYWLSANISSFLKEESRFPKWLNIAVGYGIDGFVSSDDNIFERDGQIYDYTHIVQQRQFYLSPDIDLTRLPIENKGLKIAFRMLNCIKFPLPVIGYDTEKQSVSFNFIQF